ncbi:MAG TPA: thiamine pyrophosphate-binding protein, partial [Thermomicrobiaceae bacterium]|nr:thiamine pyrophosphate-binding protein [Thermomicrobiaceae bacterium]
MLVERRDQKGTTVAVMTGGQALARSLRKQGVDTVFGLPGVQLDWLFD